MHEIILIDILGEFINETNLLTIVKINLNLFSRIWPKIKVWNSYSNEYGKQS